MQRLPRAVKAGALLSVSLASGAMLASCAATDSPAPAPSASAVVAPASAKPKEGVDCRLGKRVVDDLIAMSQAKESATASAAQNAVAQTTSDLTTLVSDSTNVKLVDSATSTREALQALLTLAQKDPAGQQANTSKKAVRLGKTYVESSNNLRTVISKACG